MPNEKPKTPHPNSRAQAQRLLETIWTAVQGAPSCLDSIDFKGEGHLPSYFGVTDLAAASMGAAGLALASLIECLENTSTNTNASNKRPSPIPIKVDQRLASFWFASTLRPQGWKPPALHEVASADYLAQDGWLRLHTNAAHHRAAAARVLGCEATLQAMTAAALAWKRDELVEQVVAAGGCAATMLSPEQWRSHPQGQALQQEPLIEWTPGSQGDKSPWAFQREQPLRGIKVLDMTRVLAGPAATRMIAGLGAQVLRLDPPEWNEANAPEMTLGKHCAELDLRDPTHRATWIKLLSEADVLVHGYRSDALARLGLDAQTRQQIRPGLIDVSLDAYGFTGPWHNRRGFDSLVQMSMGFAYAGQQYANSSRPEPLPVQALDHATGYLLATAVLRGLEQRLRIGQGAIARASLARTGVLLMSTMDAEAIHRPTLMPETPADIDKTTETTAWGPAHRLLWPIDMSGVQMRWSIGAGPLRRHQANWTD